MNALQDKWPDEFIGLLAAGMRIGQFNRFTGYLESHLIGDPTFHFKNNVNPRFDINRAITLYDRDAAYWRKQLSNELPDVQAMALRQLLYAGEKNLPELYRNTYQNSDYFVVRMEAVKLLALNYPEQAVSTLKQSLNDSYELIRRLSGEYVERIGDPALIPALVNTYLNRGQEKRLTFRLNDATFSFDSTLLEEELSHQLQGRILYSDTLVVKFRKSIDNDKKHIISDRKELAELGQKLSVYRNNIYAYRNHPTPLMINDLINIASDQNRPIEVRAYAVQTLSWYHISYRRKDIIQALNDIKTDDKELSGELVRSIHRLQGK